MRFGLPTSPVVSGVIVAALSPRPVCAWPPPHRGPRHSPWRVATTHSPCPTVLEGQVEPDQVEVEAHHVGGEDPQRLVRAAPGRSGRRRTRRSGGEGTRRSGSHETGCSCQRCAPRAAPTPPRCMGAAVRGRVGRGGPDDGRASGRAAPGHTEQPRARCDGERRAPRPRIRWWCVAPASPAAEAHGRLACRQPRKTSNSIAGSSPPWWLSPCCCSLQRPVSWSRSPPPTAPRRRRPRPRRSRRRVMAQRSVPPTMPPGPGEAHLPGHPPRRTSRPRPRVRPRLPRVDRR